MEDVQLGFEVGNVDLETVGERLMVLLHHEDAEPALLVQDLAEAHLVVRIVERARVGMRGEILHDAAGVPHLAERDRDLVAPGLLAVELFGLGGELASAEMTAQAGLREPVVNVEQLNERSSFQNAIRKNPVTK